MNARSRWTEPSNVMYDPNPYSRPAENAAGHHFTHLRETRNIEVAELASATRIRRLNDATGPSANVTGAARRPSKGTDVFEARFTPRGKSM